MPLVPGSEPGEALYEDGVGVGGHTGDVAQRRKP